MSYVAVMPSVITMSRLISLAEEQWGLVTRRQAQLAGVPAATLTRLISEGTLDRIAHGVYRLAGAPLADHLELRAAWLQLAPDVAAWERRPEQGLVSHRSAAALYGVGHLPADTHEFTLPARRQTRRRDVRLHLGAVEDRWISLRGLPVTRPSRIAADLLREREDPEAVAHIVVDALRAVYDYPGTFAVTLAPAAAQLGLRRGDGMAVLRWLLDLVGDRDGTEWLAEAAAFPGDRKARSKP